MNALRKSWQNFSSPAARTDYLFAFRALLQHLFGGSVRVPFPNSMVSKARDITVNKGF